MNKLIISLFISFCVSVSLAVPLKKVFGVGQADYHRIIYAKTWAWLKEQKNIVATKPDEKKFLALVDQCLSQVHSFSEALNDDVDINYLRVILAKDSTQVQLYCPSGTLQVWNIEKKEIETYKLVKEIPKQVDLSILGHVQKGFDLAPVFFESTNKKRLIFLKPISGTDKFQVHPFADPDRYVILDESMKDLEYSTRILVIENHSEAIKKLVYKFIDEFGIIPDRMFSTQNSLGIILP